MKWILYVVLAIAALVALIALIGAALPKGHVASRRARFRQTPDALFAVISGPPDWRPDVKSFEPLPDAGGKRRWKEVGGWGDAITYEMVELAPPRRMVTRIADENLPYGGSWTHELVPDGDSCVLRITENGEVKNPIFRFLSRFVFGQTGSLEKYLEALGHKFGEAVKVEE
jgi:Polyketide cyclase / dehydrase and lipid transport